MSQQHDALDTLGRHITNLIPKGQRDAIHLAVIACDAGEELWPGNNVRLDPETGRAWSARLAHDEAHLPIGIVDPFIPRAVQPGHRFWLVLYPRTITGLRHVWSHPNFPEQV